jgi:iron(II)-dependent oxidoreductase
MKRIGAIIVGLACLSAAAHAAAPAYSDFSDAPFRDVEIGMEKMKDARVTTVGYDRVKDPNVGKPSQALEWVSIPGGNFTLGTSDAPDSKPIEGKTYNIKTFYVSKTLVTVEQYAECVFTGECMKPDTGKYCNWGKQGRELHPVNCVDWGQAKQYATFVSKKPGFAGARLLTETEYEYAATSGGKNQKYPWGNDAVTCDRAVMYEKGDYGCGTGATMPVCSKPEGNTAQGLCDMVGNLWQWIQDTYADTYANTPTDGRAWEGPGRFRVTRGGSLGSRGKRYLRADDRSHADPTGRHNSVGFRLAMSSR